MKKLLSLLLFSLFLSMNTFTYALAVGATLPNNTPVEIQAVNNYNPDNLSAGDNITFTTVNNITLNGKTVIAKGSTVNATVKSTQKRKRIGKSAEITVGDFYTVSTKGTKVPLTGAISKKGKSRTGLSIALSILVFPLFLLMKGKNTSIGQGEQVTVYTANPISL